MKLAKIVSNAKLWVVALCLLSSTYGISQGYYNLGIGGGAHFNMLNSERGEYDGILGFQGGLIQEIRFNENFSIQADLFFTQKGGDRVINGKKYEDSIVNYYDRKEYWDIKQESFRMSYVDAHILFKYNIPIGYERIVPYDRPGKRVFISVYGGPMIGYLMQFQRIARTDTVFKAIVADDTTLQAMLDELSAKKRGRTKDDDFETFKESKGYDPILKTDLGITVGAGLNFMVGEKMTLNFDLRYTHGLGTIDNLAFSQKKMIQEPDPINSRLEYHQIQVNNRIIAFTAGVRWRVIGKGPNRNF